MIYNDVYILAVLSFLIAATEWLVRRTVFKHFGTALLVILLTALVANVGLLPAGSTDENPVPVYDWIFGVVAPLSILWLLLKVNLRDVLRAGLPIIALFLIGSLGTVAGVLVGMWIVDGPETVGPLYHAIGGMFVGTYTGGSVNFNAVALTYDVMREGVLYTGSVVVDNIITTGWMIATLALPRLLAPVWKLRSGGVPQARGEVSLGIEEDTETMHPMDLGLVLALGLGAVWISDRAAEALAGVGVTLPSIIILTALALVLAQIPAITRLRGARTLAMYAVYLFLAVIGAFCDLGALGEIGHLGVTLLIFATAIALVHGLVTFGAGRLLKIDLDITAVASQANIGGGTSALALARSLGREDLVLPGVLVGALGNALGTFLGFWAAEYLLPWLL
jgi:uncharacterized membrane protein